MASRWTAADVVFTYTRLRDKENASVLRAALSVVSNVEAVDRLTVRFTLSSPYTDLAAVTAQYQAQIVSESMMDTLTTKPIGTGPFRFVEYRPGDQLVVEKNPDYFVPGTPKVDRVVMYIIPEYTTAVSGLESGTIDIVYDLPPEQIDQLKDSRVSRVEEVACGSWEGIILNNAFKPFTDPRVREAFIKVVDRQAFTDISDVRPWRTHGHADPADASLLPRRSTDAPRHSWCQEVADRSWPWRWLPTRNDHWDRLALGRAAGHGLPGRGKADRRDGLVAHCPGRQVRCRNGGKDCVQRRWLLWPPHPGHNGVLLVPQQRFLEQHAVALQQPEVDRILDTARATADKAEQKRLYGRFQEIVAKDGPGCLVFVRNFACGVSKKVQGFTGSPQMWVDVNNVAIAT